MRSKGDCVNSAWDRVTVSIGAVLRGRLYGSGDHRTLSDRPLYDEENFGDIMIKKLKNKRTIGIILLISVMGIFRGIEKPNGYLFDIEFILNFILNTALLLSWMISIYTRIIHKKIRNYLLSIGGLMFFWLLIRTIKYRVLSVFVGMNILWYLYYVPIVLIPLLSYFTAQTVGHKEDHKLSRKDRSWVLPAGIIISGILTNDIHKMAFIFEGDVHVGMSYGYGIFYYLAYIFSFSFAILSVCIMFKKSRIKESKKKIYLPFVIVGIYVAYSIFYNLNQNHKLLQFIELTVAYGIATISFWESCIRIGLIRSNARYNEFFKRSTTNTWIVDHQGKTRYHTGEQHEIDPAIFERLKRQNPLLLSKSSRLHQSDITGGWVIREEKLGYILGLVEQLQTVNSKLEKEIILIQSRMDIDEKRSRYQEQARLYDIIGEHTKTQKNKIKEDLEYIIRHGDDEQRWQEITICATYIKCYSDLVSIGGSGDTVMPQDLELAIRESLHDLRRIGIREGIKIDPDGAIPKQEALRSYATFQQIIERSFRHLENIFVMIRNTRKGLRMTVLLNGNGLKSCFDDGSIPKDQDTDMIRTIEEEADDIRITTQWARSEI
ncbi:MAG: histidine kinase N-terminal 7TM domain-containing protein [Peptostreptococcaceae bacterium]|nr:histidine kinase N-terminal 7TM domain-containing protein [Peptostreptococcaceae bacterium]